MSARNSVFSFILPTRIVFGPGCLDTLAQEMVALNMKRPLIITDKGVMDAGIIKKFLDLIDDGAEVFDGVEANPRGPGCEPVRFFGAISPPLPRCRPSPWHHHGFTAPPCTAGLLAPKNSTTSRSLVRMQF